MVKGITSSPQLDTQIRQLIADGENAFKQGYKLGYLVGRSDEALDTIQRCLDENDRRIDELEGRATK